VIMRRPPLLIRAVVKAVGVVSWLVPRRDRSDWRREWEAEILSRPDRSAAGHPSTFGDQLRLAWRASGSIADAAWLRRQFTRDSEIVQDLKFGIRMSFSRPAAFLATAAILGLGIGSTAAMIGLMDRLVVHALPYPETDRLVSLYQRNLVTGDDREEVSPGTVLDWRTRATSFDGVAASEPFSVDYTSGDRPEVVYGTKVTEGFFDILRVLPQAGRLFGPADYQPGAERAVIISDRFSKRLGVAHGLPDRPVLLDGQPCVVVGVLPPGAELNLFDGRDRRDLFFPKVYADYEKQLRGSGWWAAIGRLKPGLTMDHARREMDVLSAALAEEFPQQNRDYRASVAPLETSLMRTIAPALALMLMAAGLVLIVATANVANLQLVRAVERQREFTLRAALGAGHGRLVRQMFTEAGLLATVASVLAVGVAWLTIRGCIALAPIESTRLTGLSVDGLILALTALVGLATALACGMVPAVQLMRRGRFDVGDSRTSAGPHARRLRDVLVVSEVAIAVVLAVVVGLLGRSFARVMQVDPGFRADRLAVLQVFAWDRHETPEKLSTFFGDVFQGLRGLPGVTNVGAVLAMPFIEANINMESPLTLEGRPPARSAEAPRTFLSIATPEYFSIMNIPVRQGRLFEPADRAGSSPVALISESLARRHWPQGGAVGSHVTVRLSGRARQVEVVGVVAAVRHDGLELPARDEVFLPLAQAPYGSMTLVIATSGDPAAVLEPAKRVIWAIDPLQTIYDSGTVNQLLAVSVAPRRFALVLTSAFAVLALGLAALGVYAVLAVATRQRTREIGVRLALGASPAAIRLSVLSHALTLGVAGVILGLAVAAALARGLRAQLFSVNPVDPATMVGVAIVAISMTLAAAYGPARRAIRIDPVRALRD
jgi:putative ABC transport system permease protein